MRSWKCRTTDASVLGIEIASASPAAVLNSTTYVPSVFGPKIMIRFLPLNLTCAACGRALAETSAWKGSGERFYCNDFCAGAEETDINLIRYALSTKPPEQSRPLIDVMLPGRSERASLCESRIESKQF
jgi:hypothetical protein